MVWILGEVSNRIELVLTLIEGNSQHPSSPYIAHALFCHKYCFKVALQIDEFKHLLLNSSAESSENSLTPEQFPTLEEVVKQIKERPSFLNEIRMDGGLSGSLVQKKLDKFGQDALIQDVLLQEKWPNMRKDGSYYIIDGMHRLIAYGLWSRLEADKFPINAVLCTDSDLH